MPSSIAFLLGAGASQPYGIPAMIEFYEAFRKHLSRHHPEHFELLKRLEAASDGSSHDLETLLADLQLAQSAPGSLKLLQVELSQAQLEVGRLADLRGFLESFIIDTCERFDQQSSVDYRTILELSTREPLWIFTTNYDRVVERACEQNDIPFADGFKAAVGNPVADYDGTFDADVRVVKLHGSVNWYQDNPDGSLHRLDRGYPLPTKDFALVRGDQRLTPLMIIPTLEKQMFDHPYAKLALRFTDVIKEVGLLIIAGNSLRDKHVLNYISDRMPRLQVLMVSRNATKNVTGLRLGPGAHALDMGFREFLRSSGPALAELAERTRGAESPAAVSTAVDLFVRSVAETLVTDEAMGVDPEMARLNDLLRSNSFAERARAAASLGSFSHPRVVHRLTELLRDDDSDAVRAAAVGSLIQIGTVEAIAAASLGLTDKATPVQLEAVTGLLSRLPDDAVAVALEKGRAMLVPAARRILDAELPAHN
jgi:hypothetical protein